MRWTVWGPASLEPTVVEAALWEVIPSGALVFVDTDLRPLAAFSSWAWSSVTAADDVSGDVELAVSAQV